MYKLCIDSDFSKNFIIFIQMNHKRNLIPFQNSIKSNDYKKVPKV